MPAHGPCIDLDHDGERTACDELPASPLPIDEDGDGEGARPAAVFSWTSNAWLYDEGEAEQLAADLREVWPSVEQH